jgi:hypothetical protein
MAIRMTASDSAGRPSRRSPRTSPPISVQQVALGRAAAGESEHEVDGDAARRYPFYANRRRRAPVPTRMTTSDLGEHMNLAPLGEPNRYQPKGANDGVK